MIDAVGTDSDLITGQYRTMQKIVTDHLRKSIISGRLGPGERINQDDIAQQLGVSRMPVREALRILQSEGLIELQPHRSAVVVSLRDVDIEEIFGIRAMLEVGAARLSAPNMDPETIARLRTIHAEMESAIEDNDSDRWLVLNQAFHATLLSRCEWPRLRTLIEAQKNAVLPYQRAATALLIRTPRAHQEHSAMLEAAERNDGSSLAFLTEAHLKSTAEELIRYLSQQRASPKQMP